jgi:predicted CXXCH cytochrome family protein
MASFAMATNQPAGTGIVGTSHDLSSASGVGGSWGSGSAADGTMDRICIYCHTPHHSATIADAAADGITYFPLWNHDNTALSYATYTNGTDTPDGIQHMLNATIGQPGSVSKLCLSCHDGSVAISSYGNFEGGANSENHTGAVVASGRILVGAAGAIGLTNHHPIGFDYNDVIATGDDEIADPSTPFINNPNGVTIGEVLWNGKMECSSCHDVHNTKNSGAKFTWTEDTNSSLCLTCHIK